MAQEGGKRASRKGKKDILLWLSDEEALALDEISKASGLSRTRIIRNAIAEYLTKIRNEQCIKINV